MDFVPREFWNLKITISYFHNKGLKKKITMTEKFVAQTVARAAITQVAICYSIWVVHLTFHNYAKESSVFIPSGLNCGVEK